MFYAHFVLSKKGPLARIWLAAHWDKKLTKAHVFETNIEKSVEGILQPKVKLALRTSGHLLLGVVRIYSRKAKYLLADCNEAFVKIKMAFRPGMVDLPEESREAAVNAITLPEVFHDFDNDLNELNDVDIQAQFALNQSRAEEITMREDFGNLQVNSQFDADDNFSGNVGLESAEASELLRDDNEVHDNELGLMDSDFGASRMTRSKGMAALDASAALELPPTPVVSHNGMEPPAHAAGVDDDGFGGTIGSDIMAGGLFEGGIFDDVPMDVPNPPEPLDETLVPDPESVPAADLVEPQVQHADPEPGPSTAGPGTVAGIDEPGPSQPDGDDSDDEYIDNFGADGPPSVGGSSRSASPAPSAVPEAEIMGPPPAPRQTRSSAAAAANAAAAAASAVVGAAEITATAEQTTLIQNEDESFALAPVDASALKGWPRARRKRKLIVDEVKNISGEEMKAQLADTSDILTTLDLAPPTKRLMHWKETGGVERLFALSGRNIPGKSLFKIYTRHLQARQLDNDELPDGPPEDAIQLPDAPQEEEEREKRQSRQEAEEEARDEDKENQTENVELRRSERRGRKRKTMEESELERQQLEEQFQQLQQSTVQEPQAMRTIVEEQTSTVAPPVPSTPAEEQGSIIEPPPPLTGAPDLAVQIPEPPPVPVPEADESSTVLPLAAPGQPEMANMGWDGPDPNVQPIGEGPNSPFSVRGPYPMMTPGHDFDFPPSVAPSMGAPGVADEPEDVQATDETYEEYEERVLNKRAVQMHRLFKVKFDELAEDTAAATHERRLEFHSLLSRNNNRKQVSQKFYTLLVLKKAKAIELDQEESFGPICITKGPEFDTCKL